MEQAASTVEALLHAKGDLHDCKVSNIAWSLELSRLEVLISDVNANFLGLPEYSGPQSGRLICDGVRSVRADVAPTDEKLRLYEASLSLQDGIHVLELLFSPAGKLVVHSTATSFQIR